MCDCIYHSAKEVKKKKTEFVNVKVPVTVKIRQYLICIFLFAVNTMLHNYFICCGHNVTSPKTRKVYIGSC